MVVDGKVITRPHLRARRGPTATSPRTTRRPDRKLEVLHRGRRRRPGRRKLGRRRRRTSGSAPPWGLPGTYDPVRKLIYWGIANPTPNTRAGAPPATPTRFRRRRRPICTATRRWRSIPTTGKLVWYYQHLPGDDWDKDYTHERTLLRTAVSPDPKFVKWINPDIRTGEQRDIAVRSARAAACSRSIARTGQFLWANAVPLRRAELPDLQHRRQDRQGHDQQGSACSRAGRAPRHLLLEHAELLADGLPPAPQRALRAVPGQLPGHDRADSRATASRRCREARRHPRAGAEPEEFGGLAKINMATGEMKHIYKGRAPGNGAVLATAGDLVFWGDLDRQVPRVRRATAARCCGRRRSAARSTTARLPTPSTASSTSPCMTGEGPADRRADRAGRHLAGAEAQ